MTNKVVSSRTQNPMREEACDLFEKLDWSSGCQMLANFFIPFCGCAYTQEQVVKCNIAFNNLTDCEEAVEMINAAIAICIKAKVLRRNRRQGKVFIEVNFK